MPRATNLWLPTAGMLLVVSELPLVAHGGEDHGTTWWGWVLLGRFHVLVVHFPIALIILIGLIEAWRWWQRDESHNALLLPLSLLTAVSAVIAAGMGWLQAASMAPAGTAAELLLIHRWTGTVTAGVAVVIAMTRWRLERAPSTRFTMVHRGGVAVGVSLVAITGHVGGLLVHGEDYLSSALPWARAQAPTEHPMSATLKPYDAMPADGHRGPVGEPDGARTTIEFVRDIAPVLSVCLECHGPAKQQGDLRVDSRKALLSGGVTGPAIIPGRGNDSLLVQRLRGEGGDPRMPKKKEPIPEAIIRTIVRWIDEGAEWPDGIQVLAP